MKIKILTILILLLSINGCGKVGPLAFPEDKLDKSVITKLIPPFFFNVRILVIIIPDLATIYIPGSKEIL